MTVGKPLLGVLKRKFYGLLSKPTIEKFDAGGDKCPVFEYANEELFLGLSEEIISYKYDMQESILYNRVK